MHLICCTCTILSQVEAKRILGRYPRSEMDGAKVPLAAAACEHSGQGRTQVIHCGWAALQWSWSSPIMKSGMSPRGGRNAARRGHHLRGNAPVHLEESTPVNLSPLVAISPPKVSRRGPKLVHRVEKQRKDELRLKLT
ncbi:hypothetical protein FIBSPDRAFT_602968 [Athelia psychrophila]|uniref:Uncharacterized protein n=1 Tax=Athelia psychrophila TaxID=1759441 RepID=A0A166GQ85_9AGAM|nr:hypothetical protein FIBSPDRAFT_602968 [Fibularhizoctonia sp. CBS 109695]